MRISHLRLRKSEICHIDDATHTLRFLRCHVAAIATNGNPSPLAAVGRGI